MAIVSMSPPRQRTHVGPHDWGEKPFATDYWLDANSADHVAASAANNVRGLDSFGWTTTSLALAPVATSDFLSSADYAPNIFRGDAASDLMASPAIFGAYGARLQVGSSLGYLPTKLCCDIQGLFSVASANEATTYLGFHNGAAITMAVISNGTNFLLSNGVSTDAGIAVDNVNRIWRIVITFGGTAEWFVSTDGVTYTSQGTLAITEDVWPAALIFAAGTTNRWGAAWAHVWYE